MTPKHINNLNFVQTSRTPRTLQNSRDLFYRVGGSLKLTILRAFELGMIPAEVSTTILN